MDEFKMRYDPKELKTVRTIIFEFRSKTVVFLDAGSRPICRRSRNGLVDSKALLEGVKDECSIILAAIADWTGKQFQKQPESREDQEIWRAE